MTDQTITATATSRPLTAEDIVTARLEVAQAAFDAADAAVTDATAYAVTVQYMGKLIGKRANAARNLADAQERYDAIMARFVDLTGDDDTPCSARRRAS